MLTNRIYTFLLLVIFFTTNAFALNLQSYHFSDSYRYAVLDDALNEKFDGKYIFTASFAHMNSPFYFSDRNLNENKREIIDYNNILTAGFSYYLSEKMSVGVDINALQNETFNQSYTSFADSVIKSRISLFKGKTHSFSINPQVIIPTGNPDNFSTMSSVSGSISGVFEKSFDRFHLLASVGALSSKNNEFEDVDHRQLLLSQLGVSYDMNDKWNVNVETYRNFPLVDDKYQDQGQYMLTAKHKTHRRFSTYFGGGASGLDDVQRNTYVVFIGLKFHEPAMVASTIAMAQAAPVRTPEIFFEHNSSAITDEQAEKLNNLVQRFTGSKHVSIEGYASKPGSVPYNQALSERRAEEVKKYFIQQGLEENKLSTIGHGETFEQDPVEANNRKVNFIVE